ncbi:MAG: tRNA (adenosine(37)-N6)-threonylcarbamoyltransferase complex ATPase subunit type 1 TsaE, partial [Patescibacteria group bacterium]
QFFAKALGIKRKIQSPTFVIVKKHEIRSTKSETISKSKNLKFKTLVHIDAYRIEKPKEILELGWRKLIANPQNIILIEWADIIKKILPKDYIRIKLRIVDERRREIRLKIKNQNAKIKNTNQK